MKTVLLLAALIIVICSLHTVLCFVPPFPDLPFGIYSKDNAACRSDSELIRYGLENNTYWAFQIWDSSAKGSTGISNGILHQLGHYDECLSVKGPIKTKYCMIDIKINLNITIIDPYTINFDPYSDFYQKIMITQDPSKPIRNIAHVGICIPDSCSYRDTENYLQNYINENNVHANITYDVGVEFETCQNEEIAKQFTINDLIFGILVMTILVLVVSGTIIDSKYHENEHLIIKVLLCFSITSNEKDLHRLDKNTALHPIYIIRSFLIIFIVMGHSGVISYLGPVYDYTKVEKYAKDISDMWISRADLVIEIFFVMGGLLATYNYLKQSEQQEVQPIKSILMRYVRFAPVFAFMTFFYSTWYTKVNSGPLWHKIVGSEVKNCQANWWTNILLINNYVNVENCCMLQGWYIANDFQLFVLTFPLKILLRKKEKLGLFVLGLVCLIFGIVSGLVPYYLNTGPFLYMYPTNFRSYKTARAWKYLYTPTHTRGASYIIGMLFGYIYYKLKSSDFKISKIISYILIVFCISIMATCTMTAFKFYNDYIKYTPLEEALYSAIHRPVFAFCVGVLLFVWSYTQISIPSMKTVFPLYFFVPFSKLTYGIYMIHMLYQYMRAGSMRTFSRDTFYLSTTYGLSELLYSSICSSFLFLTVENSSVKLFKLLISSNKKIEKKN